ncbi:DUF1684 domain-containing protein [Pararhodonellum marinum]|uniref:DUF1684 domain-containing protein n=1 Tax=Pararhodonellum marinum TaxID=2755358 RepID=UPI00188FBF48|nr:DUF1684 domain-containing protein [Pararhodonellum marinum]
MSKKNILLGIVVLVILASITYTFVASDNPAVYQENIEKERERQFKYLKYNPDSPLTEEQKRELDSLSYFPIDANFKIKARVVPVRNKRVIELPMTDGSVEKYIRDSFAEFDLEGTTHRLLLLQAVSEPDRRNYFLAFADETSASETYGGGRYLNLKKDGQNSITIDFNLAYNPYCAYNPDFACPLPPAENLLTVPVRAGEKKY